MNSKIFILILTLIITISAPVYSNKITLSVEKGNNQSMLVNSTSEPFIVKIMDHNGKGIAGQKISFIIGEKPSKDKAFQLEPAFLITDDKGYISYSIKSNEIHGNYSIIALVSEKPETYVKLSANVKEASWVMYILFGLAGGLGMFLFGMNLGSDGLQKIAGKKMKVFLSKITNNKFMAIFTGIMITAVTQSSSATTVMLVGFVNASLMSFAQTLGVIMGANIGTTITVQLIAFDISTYALLMIGIGFLLKYSSKKETKYIGNIILGFGFIFYGMKVMSLSMSPLRSYPAFKSLLVSISQYPISAIFGSMLFTALIQSSGATIGLVVAFSSQGLIDLNSAIPLILGAHTGTCITGWIASIGGCVEAKKTALLNVIYNLLGTLLFIPFLYKFAPFSSLVRMFTSPFSTSAAREVANAHMISAIIKVMLLVPFYDQIINIANKVITDDSAHGKPKIRTKYLSENLIQMPELALGNVAREISRMAGHVEYMMNNVFPILEKSDDEVIEDILFREEKVDSLQYEITKYLSRLSEGTLTEEQSAIMVKYMHIINDLEGLADLIDKIIVPFARNKEDDDIRFSQEGFDELKEMFNKINELFMLSINAFATGNHTLAEKVLKSHFRIYRLEKELRTSHMKRVLDGKGESLESSTLHLDLLNCFKRINTHSVNISKAITGEWFSFKSNYSLDEEA